MTLKALFGLCVYDVRMSIALGARKPFAATKTALRTVTGALSVLNFGLHVVSYVWRRNMSESPRHLNSPVLILNKAWQAYDTISVKQAIIDMTRGAVRGLCMETYMLYSWEGWTTGDISPAGTGFIKAAGGKKIVAPDVVVCASYEGFHVKTLFLGKRSVHIRDGFTCQYCKKKKRPKDLSIDHVFPRSKGGPNSWENCVTACVPCNQKKADKTLREAGLSLDPKPTKPTWTPVGHLSPSAQLPSWDNLLRRKG